MKKTVKLDPKTLKVVAKELAAYARANAQLANHPEVTSSQMAEECLAVAKAFRVFAGLYRNQARTLESKKKR